MCLNKKFIHPKRHDAFVSYSHQDKGFVETLCSMLREKDLSTWVDWENTPITRGWWQEVQEGIESANSLIFIISPESIRSNYCCAEVAYAIKHNKQLIPAVFETVSKNLWQENLNSYEEISTKSKIITHKQEQKLAWRNIFEVLMEYEWIYFDVTADLNSSFQKLVDLISFNSGYISTCSISN